MKINVGAFKAIRSAGIYEFYIYYSKLVRSMVTAPRTNANIRFGQDVYNQLHNDYPDIADSINGTTYDMFYSDQAVYDFKRILKRLLNQLTIDINGNNLCVGDRVIVARPDGTLSETEIFKITKKSIVMANGKWVSIPKSHVRIFKLH